MRAACNLGFWHEFLLPIPLYVFLGVDREQFWIVLGVSNVYLTLCSSRVGRGQFVNWERVSIANFTVCSPRSGLCAVWYFGGSF